MQMRSQNFSCPRSCGNPPIHSLGRAQLTCMTPRPDLVHSTLSACAFTPSALPYLPEEFRSFSGPQFKYCLPDCTLRLAVVLGCISGHLLWTPGSVWNQALTGFISQKVGWDPGKMPHPSQDGIGGVCVALTLRHHCQLLKFSPAECRHGMWKPLYDFTEWIVSSSIFLDGK